MIFGSYGAETKEKQPQDHTRPDSDAAEEASLSSKKDSFVRRTSSTGLNRTPSTGLSINLCMHAACICVLISLPVFLFTPFPIFLCREHYFPALIAFSLLGTQMEVLRTAKDKSPVSNSPRARRLATLSKTPRRTESPEPTVPYGVSAP
jgi:hypothetical protein